MTVEKHANFNASGLTFLWHERFKGFLGATHDFHERGSVLANGVKKRYCGTDWPTSVSFSSL